MSFGHKWLKARRPSHLSNNEVTSLVLRYFCSMKILVVRFSSIGDIVLTTPILRVLAQNGHEVHFLTKKNYSQVLEGNPHITKIHFLRDDWNLMLDSLRKERFYHIVDLHRNLRSARLKIQLGIRHSTFSKINWQKWLAVHIHEKFLPEVHIVDRYFQALKPLSLEKDGLGLEFHFSEGFSFSSRSFLKAQGMKSGGYIVWILGGAHKTKCYPEDKIADALKHITYQVVLVGGPDEKEMGERLAGHFNHVYNACGDLSISESAMIVKESTKVVTNDTGMMHIAAAFQKPIVVLWGNTIPAFGMYPYMPGNQARWLSLQVEGLTCRPCSKIGYEQCPKKHFRCMRDIESLKVVEALNSPTV